MQPPMLQQAQIQNALIHQPGPSRWITQVLHAQRHAQSTSPTLIKKVHHDEVGAIPRHVLADSEAAAVPMHHTHLQATQECKQADGEAAAVPMHPRPHARIQTGWYAWNLKASHATTSSFCTPAYQASISMLLPSTTSKMLALVEETHGSLGQCVLFLC